MKRIIVAGIATCLSTVVLAQTPVNPIYGNGSGGWVPTDVTHPFPVLPLGPGGGAASFPSVPTTPASPGQFGLGVVTSTALTVPTGATYAVVCARTQNVDWTTDGTTAPTASVGTQLLVNSCVGLLGATTLANFRAIQQAATATLDVQYWKP
jgi:hypothetical protein